MKYTAVDQRLENKLRELYETHMARAAKVDWSYHALIPWERARNFVIDPWHPSQATISPELTVAVETALLTEVNLPWFTAGLSGFAGVMEVLYDFVRTWVSEEDQHATILDTYLMVTRNDDPQRVHRLRKTVIRGAWTPPVSTTLDAMVYTAVQELATQAYYVNVSRKADEEDPVLAHILRTIAKDETLHYTFYRDAVKAHLEVDPNNVWAVCRVLTAFAMPGQLMPDFHERQRIIAAGANYGIAEYYRQVVDVLVRHWDIKRLQPTYPEVQEALDRLNRYLDGLARLAARASNMKPDPQAVRQAAAGLLAR